MGSDSPSQALKHRTAQHGRESQASTRWVLVLILFTLALAPGCAALRHSNELWHRSWAGFTNPGNADAQIGLLAHDGYEPGKIPVILIHGLMSDAMTWDETIIKLKADERIASRFQFWTYRYPTGTSYLQSAADLRYELTRTLETLDPNRRDPALNQIVLVGHSMGGLIAKLQVSNSGNEFWQTVSDRPLEEVITEPSERQQLARVVYFEPQPNVKRVVFIATPHQGSQWSGHPLGRFGRRLIEFPSDLQDRYGSWIEKHKGTLRNAPESIPTSIDHLDPKSPVMLATANVPIAPRVKLHSIVGKGYRLPDWSEGDGVVSSQSAHLENAASELAVEARHSTLHSDEATIAELKRILFEHDVEICAGEVSQRWR